MRILCFLLFVALLMPRQAEASRRGFMPVGYYAMQLDLAMVADVSKPVAPDFEYKLKVREVLQGQAQIGEIISLPGLRSTADVSLHGASTVAVLLKKNKETGAAWQVLEAYRSPQSIASLRLLLAIYQLPAERQQLVALQKLLRDTPEAPEVLELAMITAELEAALIDMRQPGNFDLIQSSLPLLNEKQRESMMRALGAMNDLRAVPLLLAALQAPEKSIRNHAAQSLAYRYPGAPGVEEAMRALLRDETSTEFLKRTAQDYLSKRDASIVIEQKQTPYLEAQQLLRSGRKAEGALAHLVLLENQKADAYFSYWTAEEILPYLDAEGKTRLRHVLIKRALKKPSYLEAESILKLLHHMPHPEAVPALLNLLNEPQPSTISFIWRKAAMLSTFLLRDLGPQAREQATARLLENRRRTDNKNDEEATVFLLQLAWLADDRTWQALPETIAPELRNHWQNLQPLRTALSEETEGRNLIALFKKTPPSGQVREWTIYRLGDLREGAAIELLLEELSKLYYVSQAPKETLIAIGGPEVDTGASKLLRHSQLEVRQQAMEILRALRGEKMRPLLREILTAPDEPPFGNKSNAAMMLGSLGTPEELPLLLPYADFWKAHRGVQGWAADSVASIRGRFNLDINGPIQKAG